MQSFLVLVILPSLSMCNESGMYIYFDILYLVMYCKLFKGAWEH